MIHHRVNTTGLFVLNVQRGPVNATYLTATLSTAAPPNGTTVQQYEPYQLIWTGEVLFRVITLVIVMFFTLVGNTTLILSIMCYPRQRRKRVNIFLVNLAVGDLMVCLFTMTTEILFVAFGEWVMGALACKVIVYGQIVTLASATFLLTGMSIDRYQVLVQPLRSLAGRPMIWKKVITAWILAFAFAIPQLLIFVQTNEGVYPDGRVKHLCKSQGYTAKWQRKLYFTFLTTYILVIPVIIMSFCYINIIRVVWKRTDSGPDEPRLKVRFPHVRTRSGRQRSRNGNVNGHAQLPERVNRRRSASAFCQGRVTIPKKLVSSSKRKVVKMTLSVIVGFLICWTPYFVVSLARIFSDYRYKLKGGLAVAEIMALVHSALNPILYGIFSSKLKSSILLRMIRCRFQSGSLDKIDEAISEDDTTWTEFRRCSMEMAKRNYGNRSLWQRCLQCCLGTDHGRPYGDATSMTFYHELLPNGHTDGNRAVTTETDSSDTEAAQEKQAVVFVGRPGCRRSTVSLIFTNHNTDPAEGTDAISAL